MDYTGTGNSLNPVHPSVLRLIMDSLRYFVIECHVDGFRFDLASALAREFHEVDRLSAFFDIIHQDPILSQVKLIAEPWDVGEGGYQVGNFPVLWTEWNGIYRDTMRDFWRGAGAGRASSRRASPARATSTSTTAGGRSRRSTSSPRTTGSRSATSSPTTRSTTRRTSRANQDGDNHNRSWNHGVEGETDDPAINALRERQMRNFLATLFLSQGVPMLLGGDEIARTQRGNNNAYCQDNEISWIDWGLDERAERQLAFTKRLIELRSKHPVFHRADFLTGEERLGSGAPDVWWFRPDGRKMTQRNWRDDDALTLGVFLNGSEIPTQSAAGRAGDRRHLPDPLQRLAGPDRLHAPGRLVRPPLDARALDRRAGARAGRRPSTRPAASSRSRGARSSSSAGSAEWRQFRATYRLQLGPGLGFREARELVPYLRDLGVSHLYLSPSLQARSGSTHGYDVVDPTRISEDLGGEEEFRALCSADGAGLGVVLDIVPNHMAASDENPFWRDPLWRAKFFDLDWRTGAHRRFFDVGELAGVRMEDPEVWEVTHAKVVELAQEGLVDGVRIDHPDGLANPRRYLERLREAGIEHVWVEKILEPGERLRPEWPVEGTTGYEFLNDVTALFVDPAGEEPLTRALRGADRRAAAVRARSRRRRSSSRRGRRSPRRPLSWPRSCPFDADVERALASFHVYRTYVEPDTGLVTADGPRARSRRRGCPDDLARILLLEERGHDAFVVRFQQTTPPVHAKGVEDTAFYRWNRFVALNEVGGDPARFSLSVADFHAANLARPPARPARDDDARHEAQRRRARAARRDRVATRPPGRRSSGRASTAGATRTRRT